MPSKNSRRNRPVIAPAAAVCAAAGSGPAAPLGDLREEISLLRGAIRVVRERSAGGDEISLDEMLKVLDVISRAATRLAQLLEAQRGLDESVGVAAAFTTAFEAALRDQGLDY